MNSDVRWSASIVRSISAHVVWTIDSSGVPERLQQHDRRGVELAAGVVDAELDIGQHPVGVRVGDQQRAGRAGRRGGELVPVDQPHRGLHRVDPEPRPDDVEEDADAQPAVASLGDPEQLQGQAELLRVGDVVGLDLGDPLAGDVVEGHRGAEGEPGEDRHLGRGVRALDVIGRVGLRVAEFLGALEGVRVRCAGAGHLREDEVRGPVDDPEDLRYLGRGEALLDHPDDRHHPRHRCLEAKLDALPGGPRRTARRRAGRSAACSPSPRGGRREVPAGRSRAPARSRRSARRRSPSPRGSARNPPRCAEGRRRPPDGGPRWRRSRRRARRPGRERPSRPCRSRAGRSERRQPASRASEVVPGLATDHEAGIAVAAEDDRRAGHAVVVARHRVAVGAGRRGDEQIAGTRRCEQRVLDQHVPGLAVHPGDRSPRCRAWPRRGWRRSPRSVTRRASGEGCPTSHRSRTHMSALPGSP